MQASGLTEFIPFICISAQFISVTQSRPDPMDCSMLGFPVHHQLPELAVWGQILSPDCLHP